MGQQVRKRFIQTVDYEANNTESEGLSRGMVYRELYLRLTGQLDIPMADNTAAKTLRGDEWALIKNIEIKANNSDTIKSIDGPALWWLNYFMYGRPPALASELGESSIDDPEFDTILILPFWSPRTVRPIDTALDTRQLSDLKIHITWGSHLDVNADADGFITAPKLEVGTLESFNVTGPFAQWRLHKIEKEITANSDAFQIQLPVGNVYRGFLINTTDADVDQGDIMTNFKWKSGTTVFADQHAQMLQQPEILRRALQDVSRKGSNNSRDGWYYYDHITDGMNTEAIDTVGFSEIELELKVAVGGGTTKVRVYPMELIPVRQRQQ